MTHNIFSTIISDIIKEIYLKDNTAKAIYLSGSKERAHKLIAILLPDNCTSVKLF